MLEPAVLAHAPTNARARCVAVQRAHARADRVGDGLETEHPRERGVAGEQRAVGPRHVHAEQRALEELAIPHVEPTRADRDADRHPSA